MKWKQLTILFTGLILFSACALAQSSSDKVVDTTLCDIVKAPQQFKGERVRIRAWLWSDYRKWPDYRKYWMTDGSSIELGRVCGWLPAEFEHPVAVGSSVFGTFTGRLISVPTRNRFGALSSCGRFIIEKQSDIYREEQRELVMKPFLYDHDRRSVVEPGACLLL